MIPRPLYLLLFGLSLICALIAVSTDEIWRNPELVTYTFGPILLSVVGAGLWKEQSSWGQTNRAIWISALGLSAIPLYWLVSNQIGGILWFGVQAFWLFGVMALLLTWSMHRLYVLIRARGLKRDRP